MFWQMRCRVLLHGDWWLSFWLTIHHLGVGVLRVLRVRPGPESSNKHLVLIVFSFLSSLVSYWLS